MKSRLTAYIFGIVALVHLSSLYWGLENIADASKPFLLISLGFHYWLSASSTRRKREFLLSLFAIAFSFFGDVLLLQLKWQPEKGYFFLLGLGSFLLAHVFYMLRFREMQGRHLQKQPWLIIPVLLYLLAFLWYLWPDIPGDFQVPVGVYGVVISLMALSAIHYSGGQSASIRFKLIAGAILFILSDSLIAVGKFSFQADFSSWIMLTYIAAQWMIIRGILEAESV
ncbi:MAG: lysoplasmalogenase [Bacteroidetes bacterium]|nr:lysoplasmalogenase [Bacteroidota bacterium]